VSLPEGFVTKYTKLLGDEAPAFFASYDAPAGTGFRINPLRPNAKSVNLDLSDPISYSKWGYRGHVDGNDIDHVSGYVYSQEPSAQVVGAVANAQPGTRVLDLCAAPGGKSTHLASAMNNEGLLVANEIHPTRVKVLASNLERFGVRNAIVTNTDPDSLAAVLPEFFDMILVDAPCSGEGMFRKDPDAMQYWHEGYAEECAQRQREILDAALLMLKPGGVLVYSTCTFAPEEDEQIAASLMHEHGMQIDPIDRTDDMRPGHPEWADGTPELAGTIRMWPQVQRGEGHFCARLIKPGEPVVAPTKKGKKGKKQRMNQTSITAEQQQLWREWQAANLNVTLPGFPVAFGDQLYMQPAGAPKFGRVKVLRPGLHLGTFKKNRFAPSHSLATALNPEDFKCVIDVSDDEFRDYRHGLTIARPSLAGKFHVLLTNQGKSFAIGHLVNGTVKNLYPKGLRV
jgi:NOL1/NOP2/sun family putative RNA methylase